MKDKNSLFKKIFEEFLDDLEVIKPYDPALTLARSATGFLPAELMISQFRENTRAYKDKIIQRDEVFFLNNNFEDAGDFKEEIDRIKSIWYDESVSSEDKEIVWNYLILLVKIAFLD